jgi:hypothetical protein
MQKQVEKYLQTKNQERDFGRNMLSGRWKKIRKDWN